MASIDINGLEKNTEKGMFQLLKTCTYTSNYQIQQTPDKRPSKSLQGTMCKIAHFARQMGGQNFHKFNAVLTSRDYI